VKHNTNVALLNKLIAESDVIGEMNHIGRDTKYSNPMIKWKNGIKKIVGLPMATALGLNI
jgi:hypothetical protein